MAQLSSATPPYIDEVLGAGQKSVYAFTLTTTGTPNTDEVMWWGQANPISYNQSGNRTFFVDQSGVLRGSDIGGGAATPALADPASGGNFPPVGS